MSSHPHMFPEVHLSLPEKTSISTSFNINIRTLVSLSPVPPEEVRSVSIATCRFCHRGSPPLPLVPDPFSSPPQELPRQRPGHPGRVPAQGRSPVTQSSFRQLLSSPVSSHSPNTSRRCSLIAHKEPYIRAPLNAPDGLRHAHV